MEEYYYQEAYIPIFDLVANGIQWLELNPKEIGRIIAIILAVIIICIVILAVVRLVVSITWPAMVMVGFILIYRLASFFEVSQTLKELPMEVLSIVSSIVNLLRESIVAFLEWRHS
ncbi:hypothetical protein KR018_001192 [Drosophila ironensis]|nr:hypothetical protein KR018_001192 [Drosophila ironensis]